MEEIELRDIGKIIKQKNINFVASVCTPWHAHGAEVSIDFLLEKGINVNALILVFPHSISGYVINQDNFKIKTNIIFYKIITKSPSIIQKIKDLIFSYFIIFKIKNPQRDDKVIYVSRSWVFPINEIKWIKKIIGDATIKTLVFDEGVATYMYQERQMNKEANVIKLLQLKYESKILLPFAKKYIPSYNLNIFINDINNNLKKNETAIRLYKNVLKKNQIAELQGFDIKLLPKTIMIGTLAYERKGIYDSEDLKVLDKIIALIYSCGFNVVLKPHPRELDYKEHYKNLKCIILEDYNVSIESIFNNPYKPAAFISFSSTALVTGKVFYDINSISICKLVNLNNFRTDISNDMRIFCKVFKSMVDMPETYNDFKNLLLSIK